MEATGSDDEFLKHRIKQLERERDDLRKDIENLCVQQAGPSYLSAATRMQSLRTAGLEEENENLRKKLAACLRDNKNLQEELSEAYRIKAHLADLHAAEVSKSIETEKQIKFFQSCIASAFAERDSSLIEAEKAKEQWETLSEKLGDYENRVCELESRYNDEKNLNGILQVGMEKLKGQIIIFEEVISKFSEIRESVLGCSDPSPLETKGSTLLNDPSEIWIFDINGNHSRYIASLEEQVATQRESIDGLQRKMRMGMDIEQYLRQRARSLEKKQIQAEKIFRHALSALQDFIGLQRHAIVMILEEESKHIKSTLDQLQEKVNMNSKKKCENSGEDTGDISSYGNVEAEGNTVEPNARDIPTRVEREKELDNGECSSSDLLAQAMKEKVEALLLLSQEDERHLLERDANAELKRRIEDLQRSFVQVTNEKVRALVDLAQLKQENHLLRLGMGAKDLNAPDGGGEKGTAVEERSERLKNLFKRTYLGRWVRRGDNAEGSQPPDPKTPLSLDLARVQAENASLRDSMAGVDQLASSICSLRLSLMKVIDDAGSAAPAETLTASLNGIFREAENIKTAQRSTLPISWSGGTDDATPTSPVKSSRSDDVDPTVAVGSEMVELLVLAAELARDYVIPHVATSAS